MSNHILHRDFETRSVADLRTTGAHKYAEDASTGVWCMSYAVDDGPIKLWTMGQPCPPEYIECASNPNWLAMAHNDAFESAIEDHHLIPKHGWPKIPLRRHRCTMAMAYAMSLPASLGQLCEALHTPASKDEEGAKLMKKMARPRRVTAVGDARYAADRSIAIDDPFMGTILPDGAVAIWWGNGPYRSRLGDYCVQDTEVERQVGKRLLPLIPSEQEFWELDQRVNNRGIKVDIPAVKAALAVVEVERGRLDAEMIAVTGGAVRKCSEVAKLMCWLAEQGVVLDSVAKTDVLTLLADPTLPEPVRVALLLRQEAARSSTAKLKAMLTGASADGRVRGTAQYHGASTGRQCIAEGSPVMTLYKTSILRQVRIEHVRPRDLVWDGYEWVSHDGVVPSGVKRVMEWDGVCATPDHMVYVSDTEQVRLEDASRIEEKLYRGSTRFCEQWPSLGLDGREVPTYDILNAGPRNRFLCNGRIVSNSGRRLQPQNFVRPTMLKFAEITEVMDLLSGYEL